MKLQAVASVLPKLLEAEWHNKLGQVWQHASLNQMCLSSETLSIQGIWSLKDARMELVAGRKFSDVMYPHLI